MIFIDDGPWHCPLPGKAGSGQCHGYHKKSMSFCLQVLYAWNWSGVLRYALAVGLEYFRSAPFLLSPFFYILGFLS